MTTETTNTDAARDIAKLLSEGAEDASRPDAVAPIPPMHTAEDPLINTQQQQKRARQKPPPQPEPPAPAMQSPAKAMAALMPPAARIHVYRREDNGKMTFIEDYDINDLRGHGSIQAFLKKYVVPKERPKAGTTEIEFHLMYQSTADKEPRPYGSVSVAIDPSVTGPESTTDMLKTMHEILMDKSKQQQQPPPNPFDEAKKALDLSEKMNSKGDGGIGAMMLLMMMRDQQQQRHVPDPTVDRLMRKIEDMERREEQKLFNQALNSPLPVPPPPAEDKFGALLVEMQKSNTQMFLKMMEIQNQPKTSNEPSVFQQLETVLRIIKPETPPMGVKDVLELFPKVKEMLLPKDDQKDGFEKLMENLRLMKMVREEFIGPQGQGDAGGFWEFAKAFVQSDLGSKIADGIQQDINGAQAKSNGKKKQEQEDGPLEIPQSFSEYAEKIEKSANIGERIGNTFQGLRHLFGFPGFRPHISKLLDLMKSNKKDEAIEQLKNILDGLCEAEAISQKTVDEVLMGARQFWVPICQKMGFKEVTVDPNPVGGAPAQQPQQQSSVPAPQTAPPAQAQPARPPKPTVKPVIEVEADEGEGEVELSDEEIKKREHVPAATAPVPVAANGGS